MVFDGLAKSDYITYRSYFQVIAELLDIEDSFQPYRVDTTMVQLLKLIKNVLHGKDCILTSVKYTKMLGEHNDKVKQWMAKNKAKVSEVLDHHPYANEPEKGIGIGGGPSSPASGARAVATSLLQKPAMLFHKGN